MKETSRRQMPRRCGAAGLALALGFLGGCASTVERDASLRYVRPGQVAVLRETDGTTMVRPPPVAERTSGEALANPVREVEGALPRVLTAPDPAQMINPVAPPEYGSGRDLVTYSEYDPFTSSTQNKRRLEPDGIRLLTIRPLW
ncbi:MAG TPA: hypothetical protein VNQ90_01675 [Chthoniobacteraceae bacterium]|nr:hypothetical protein [Chthoniobacteraceae bacterium]